MSFLFVFLSLFSFLFFSFLSLFSSFLFSFLFFFFPLFSFSLSFFLLSLFSFSLSLKKYREWQTPNLHIMTGFSLFFLFFLSFFSLFCNGKMFEGQRTVSLSLSRFSLFVSFLSLSSLSYPLFSKNKILFLFYLV